ncbi:Retrovirus-related Pol polyprotein from transposon 17.6 [Trichinella pseudospiralis]|uniref:Retrovirus-related Pol polyprotein from transposon 17.6 n=1 Tax=Trichinella pseudospiralis TaxID=6337 RepID=A0A0V1FKD9_TRIPS|nr:Retrovirus-related Pol polyprotein from transposon 17.6 [Trichinella pseudospiralis]
MAELQAGHAPSVAGKLNGLEISLLLDSGANPPEAPSGSATGEECAYAARGHCRCRWEAGGDASTSPLWKAWSILGTNFLDQYVKLIDWQDGEMTMTDCPRIRIVHKPGRSARLSIGCARVTASPGEVWERPETDSGKLEACASALVDRAFCAAYSGGADRSSHAVKLILNEQTSSSTASRPEGPSRTLDLASGYWQVEVAKTDQEKTVFSTPMGLFQFRLMPSVPCNAPATFQRLIEKAMKGLTWKTCLVYLDDIIVFGKTEEEHLQRLDRVLSRLQFVGLKIKPEKCQLMRHSVHCLSHVVTQSGIGTDPEVTEAVQRWPTPRCVKEGLKKEEAFTSMKQALVSPPILGHPDFDRTFLLDVDASEDAVGAVLSQQGEQNPPAVIANASRSL